MVQKNHKTIVVRDDTYEMLKTLGNVTQSFNDVIQNLIQKTATGQQPFQGTAGLVAVHRNDPGAIADK